MTSKLIREGSVLSQRAKRPALGPVSHTLLSLTLGWGRSGVLPPGSAVGPGLLLSCASQTDRSGAIGRDPSEYGSGDVSPPWVPTGAGVLLQRKDGIW